MRTQTTSLGLLRLFTITIACSLTGGSAACTSSHGEKYGNIEPEGYDGPLPGEAGGCDPAKVNDVPAGCGSLCVDGTWMGVNCHDAGANSGGPSFVFDDAGIPVTPAGCRKNEYQGDPCVICVDGAWRDATEEECDWTNPDVYDPDSPAGRDTWDNPGVEIPESPFETCQECIDYQCGELVAACEEEGRSCTNELTCFNLCSNRPEDPCHCEPHDLALRVNFCIIQGCALTGICEGVNIWRP